MARLAFEHCADEYARNRPHYSQTLTELIRQLTGGPDTGIAADVGAGTGIFTRQLVGAGWNVVAVEPGAAMLRHVADGLGAAAMRRLRRVCATAEATAISDGTVSLVSAAQAFHWFNPPYALAEFARILKPGGVLAIFWNNRDASRSRFVEAYEALIARYNPNYDREYRVQDWANKIAAAGPFDAPANHRFEHDWRLPQEGLIGFSRSVSYIRNVLARDEMPRFENELRTLLRDHFGGGECVIPLNTDLWTARRTGR